MSQYVFICHATEDKAVATTICEALEASGVSCWIAPRNIKPGADYSGAIVKAIGEAKALVLILSPHSNESEHVKREVERAVSRGVSIIPFRIQEVLPSEALEYFISTTQWIDAFTPPLEKHVEYLVASLKELVPPEPEEATTAAPETPIPPPAASLQRKKWILSPPGLVTLAAAAVLVVAGLLGGLYLMGSFSRSKTPLDSPKVATLPSVPEKKTETEKVSTDQILEKEQEPNDHFRDANLIALGKPVIGKLTTGNDRDWFKFKTGPDSSRVRVIVRKQFHIEVDVYDQAERKIKEDRKYGDQTISFTLDIDPSSYYYILVKPSSSSDRGSYELEVREEGEQSGPILQKPMATGKTAPEQVLDKEQEPNEHIRDANPISLGKPVLGKLTTENDRDWFKFKTGPDSNRVRIILRKQNGAYLDVYDQGERKVKEEYSPGDTILSFALDIDPNSYYYVLVKTTNALAMKRGPYELEVREEGERSGPNPEKPLATGKAVPEQVLDKEQEPNEHLKDANLIALGKPIMGRLTAENDRDWYKFKTSSNSIRVMVILRKQFGAYVDVYDQSEQYITYKYGSGDTNISLESIPNSYYYVLVKTSGGFGMGRGPYELEVREEGE